MLLTAKAYAEGGRALSLYCTLLIDKELHHPDEAVRKESAEMVALLTPIVKAFITDNAWIATSHCMQVLGGHGFIADHGMEQFVRDSRINMTYEGTNTVQSLDLLGRKVLGNQGATLKKFGAMLEEFAETCEGNEAMQEFIGPLLKAAELWSTLTFEIGSAAMKTPELVGAAAVDYMRIAGHTVFAFWFAKMAKVALEKQSSGDNFYTAKLQTARFYYAKLLPEIESCAITARAGLAPLMDTELALA
jgi:hypothetical protein